MSWHEAIDRIAMLPRGWDSYSAPTPSAVAVAKAHKLVDVLTAEGAEVCRVAPARAGGMHVYVRDGRCLLAYEIYSDGEVDGERVGEVP